MSASAVSGVDIRAQHVVVEKSSPPNESEAHTIQYIHSDLNLFYNETSSAAFFKLRFSIAAEEKDGFVYLQIQPEQIASLVQDRSNDRSPEIARLCQTSARGSVALHFTLNTPGAMIGPSKWPLPGDKVKQEALDNMHFLAAQTELVVHMPHGPIGAPQLRSLCLAASSKSLLHSSASHADLETLYEGRGGKVIHLPDAPAYVVDSLAAAPPPAYDEAAEPSQPRQTSDAQPMPSKKRRRESSDAPTATPGLAVEANTDAKSYVAVPEASERVRDQMRSYIKELCEESMAEQRASLRKEVFVELEKMETRIKLAAAEQVERLTYSVTDEVLHRIHDEIAEGVSRDELEEIIDDKVTGIKIDMEGFVEDEMRVAQDKILDHFETGMFLSRFRRSEDE
ncbi:unnamed protein product [Discula destructiva]